MHKLNLIKLLVCTISAFYTLLYLGCFTLNKNFKRIFPICMGGLFTVIGTLQTVESQGQDLHFSQFYAAPLHLNPAFAGSTHQSRLGFNFRSQWPKLNGEFVSYQFSYDQGFTEYPSAFGLQVQLDQAGSAGLQSLNAQAIYAHNLAFDGWGMRAGISLGYGNRSLNYFQLVFGDQLSPTGSNGQATRESNFEQMNIHYWDAGAGFLLYAENFWFGVSAQHLNEPDYAIGGQAESLDRKISVHSGFKLVHYRAGRTSRDSYSMSLSPAIYYSQQGKSKQLDIGANGFIEPLILGLWYRGVPIQASNNGALVAMAGFQYQTLQFLYSYDAPMGSFAANTGGAHEFSLMLELGDERKKRRFRRRNKTPAFPDLVR